MISSSFTAPYLNKQNNLSLIIFWFFFWFMLVYSGICEYDICANLLYLPIVKFCMPSVILTTIHSLWCSDFPFYTWSDMPDFMSVLWKLYTKVYTVLLYPIGCGVTKRDLGKLHIWENNVFWNKIQNCFNGLNINSHCQKYKSTQSCEI